MTFAVSYLILLFHVCLGKSSTRRFPREAAENQQPRQLSSVCATSRQVNMQMSALVGIIELCKCINHFTPRATSSSSPPLANAINGFARQQHSHVIYLNAHAELLRFRRCDRPLRYMPPSAIQFWSRREFMRAFDCGAECRVPSDGNKRARAFGRRQFCRLL